MIIIIGIVVSLISFKVVYINHFMTLYGFFDNAMLSLNILRDIKHMYLFSVPSYLYDMSAYNEQNQALVDLLKPIHQNLIDFRLQYLNNILKTDNYKSIGLLIVSNNSIPTHGDILQDFYYFWSNYEPISHWNTSTNLKCKAFVFDSPSDLKYIKIFIRNLCLNETSQEYYSISFKYYQPSNDPLVVLNNYFDPFLVDTNYLNSLVKINKAKHLSLFFRFYP